MSKNCIIIAIISSIAMMLFFYSNSKYKEEICSIRKEQCYIQCYKDTTCKRICKVEFRQCLIK